MVSKKVEDVWGRVLGREDNMRKTRGKHEENNRKTRGKQEENMSE